jgi:hypothetical protein
MEWLFAKLLSKGDATAVLPSPGFSTWSNRLPSRAYSCRAGNFPGRCNAPSAPRIGWFEPLVKFHAVAALLLA